MYAAKESGGGYEVYEERLDRHNPQRLTLIGQVRPAIEGDEFVIFYQPKVRLSDGRVAGAEALVRWEHPTLGLAPARRVHPARGEDRAAAAAHPPRDRDTCSRQWRTWADMGIRLPISVNISTRSLIDGQLPEQIEEQLRRWEVPPAFLRLELTETFLMSDSGRSTNVLDRLSDVGVGLSIDDFGTGYSSLAYLKRIPIEEIKIDRSFVMQMHVDSNDMSIVRATVELGRNLDLRVVAEGVEDVETFDRLALVRLRRGAGLLHLQARCRRSSSRAGSRSATSTPTPRCGPPTEPPAPGRLHAV